MKKVVFLDLDGTLLRDDLSISPYSRSKLIEMKKRYDFIFCTGRSLSDSWMYYNQLKLNTPVICHNGAYIKSGKDNHYKVPVEKKYIDCTNEVVSFVYKKFGERINNICISCETQTYLYNGFSDLDLLNIIVAEELPTHIVGDKIFKLGKSQRIIISIENNSLEDVDFIRRKFLNLQVGGWKNSPQIIDINIGTTNKWYAIKSFMTLNRLKQKQVMFFGDSYNDTLAIKNLENSITMKNAVEDIKGYASKTTKFCNNSDGVVNELEMR